MTLISRYGADLVRSLPFLSRRALTDETAPPQVESLLPGHIDAVKRSGHPGPPSLSPLRTSLTPLAVVWCCDPMHGNTKNAGTIKTRAMADIVTEISASIKIHASMGSKLGGVHLELTADITEGFSVTECTGGSMELGEEELGLRFESYCDRAFRFSFACGRR